MRFPLFGRDKEPVKPAISKVFKPDKFHGREDLDPKVRTSRYYRSNEGIIWREHKFPLFRVRDILADPVGYFAFQFLTMPILQAKTELAGEGEQRDLAHRACIESGLLNQYLSQGRYGIAFGFNGWELLWGDDPDVILPRGLNLLRWEDVEIIEEAQPGKDMGMFKGFRYQNRAALASIPTVVDITTDKNKAVLFTWDGELTDRYGTPIMATAWDAYRRRRYVHQDLAIYIEKHANPPWETRFPKDGKVNVGGTEMDAGEYAKMVGDALRQGNNYGLPYDPHPITGENQWAVTAKVSEDRTPLYVAADRMLRVEIMSSILMPARVITEGEHGTKAESESQAEELGMVEDAMMDALLEVFNDQILRPTLAYNFFNPDPAIRITHGAVKRHKVELRLALLNHILNAWSQGYELSPELVDQIVAETGIRVPAEGPKGIVPVKGGGVTFPGMPGREEKESAAAQVPVKPKESKEAMRREEEHDHYTSARELLTRLKREGLRRKPNEIELLVRTERQWVEFLQRELETEVEFIDSILEIVSKQRAGAEAFVTALYKETLASQYRKAQTFTLRYRAEEKRVIKGWLYEQTRYAAQEAFEEAGASGDWPGDLTPDIRSWVSSRAIAITNRLIDRIELDVRDHLTQALRIHDDARQALFRVRIYFDTLTDGSSVGSVQRVLGGVVNECISMGRMMLLERKTDGSFKYNGKDKLEGENEVVVVMRSELLDDPNLCRVCERLDGLTLRADDPDLEKWIAPHLCLGNRVKHGYRCRGYNLHIEASTRPEYYENKIVDPRKNPPLPPSWETGDF